MLEAVADRVKGTALAVFGALTIAYVHGRSLVVSGGKRRADARVHAATEQHHGAGPRV